MSADGKSTALERSPSLRRFSLEHVELCFHLLVVNGGNVLRTQRQLREEGVHVSEGAIYGWMRTFMGRYLEIEHEFSRAIGPAMAACATQIAFKALDAQERMIAELSERRDQVPARDLARCAGSLAQIMATSFETAEFFAPKQTAKPDVDSLDDLVSAMEAELGSVPPDGGGEATNEAADTPPGLTR